MFGFEMRVRLTLIEEMLGMAPGNKELYETYIISKCPEGVDPETAEVVPDLDEAMARGTTVFLRDEDGTPFMFDYHMKGFMKDACGMLRRMDDTLSAKLSAYKKVIDGVIMPAPRRIRITLPEGGKMGYNERPLRAQTPQGERIALARSETVPVGSTLEFTIMVGAQDLEPVIHEWFDYGRWRGLGQWRNSGVGRFTWELLEVVGKKEKKAAKKTDDKPEAQVTV